MNSGTLYLPDWLIVDERRAIRGGALIVASGTVSKVSADAHEAQDWARAWSGKIERLEGGVLGPGWVNAHTHLELGHLEGQVSGEGEFIDWVRRLVPLKEATPQDQWLDSVASGMRRLLAGGTTAVGDIDSIGLAQPWQSSTHPRMVVYREVLDAFHPERTAQALSALEALRFSTESSALPLHCAGVSPHAGFTASAALLQGVATRLSPLGAPVTIHWAETPEEVRWLKTGRGPMKGWLGASPKASGLQLIDRAGLLGPSLSLVHGNHPEPSDAGRIAAAGATVVHCPGSHLFFARERFALEQYRAAGVRVALGTDSLASNGDLNMAREMALLRRAHPQLEGREVLRMATANGAAALGWAGKTGALREGFAADMNFFECAESEPDHLYDFLTLTSPIPSQTWVAGRSIGS